MEIIHLFIVTDHLLCAQHWAAHSDIVITPLIASLVSLMLSAIWSSQPLNLSNHRGSAHLTVFTANLPSPCCALLSLLSLVNHCFSLELNKYLNHIFPEKAFPDPQGQVTFLL